MACEIAVHLEDARCRQSEECSVSCRPALPEFPAEATRNVPGALAHVELDSHTVTLCRDQCQAM